MNNQQAVENVVPMVQSEKTAKTFRMNYPVSEKLREEMVNGVFRDFMNYCLNEYYNDENLSELIEFVEDHDPKEDKKQALLDNLFWWQITCQYELNNQKRNCIHDYIAEHRIYFYNRPFMTSWLRECGNVVPKFYFIGHQFNDRYFIAIDILTRESLQVIVCDPNAVTPKNGELIAGILLPLGGDLYFPIVDFYHFDYKSREEMASCLQHHYKKYLKNSTMHEAFLHVLSIMLQIERIISIEKQEMD